MVDVWQKFWFQTIGIWQSKNANVIFWPIRRSLLIPVTLTETSDFLFN